MNNRYLYGKGRVFLAEKDETTGLAKVLNWLGNVATFSVAVEVTNLTHNESYTGQNLEDVRLQTAKSANFTLHPENFDVEAIALGWYGNKVTVEGDDVVAEVLPSGLVVGDEVALQNPLVSAVVVKDSAGTPATLTLGTHYVISDATTGRIKFIDLASYTQPFKVDYTFGDRKSVGMFLVPAPERWLRYEGINLANANSKFIVDLYRASLDPLAEAPFISDGTTVAGYDLKGSALLETRIAEDDELGQFGRIIDLAA